METEIAALVTKYLQELRENNAAVFVGAGFSKAAGYVDWVGLLAPIAAELGLDARKESVELVKIAQFHINAHAGNKHELNQRLINEFSDLHDPTENHAILARLPIQTYWTTNYDRLMEKALEAGGKRVDAKYTNEQLATTRRGRDAVVYKMHGDVEQPDKAILARDDYERYHLSHSPFITALSGDLVEKTFLFLGFSFTDPNLDYVLGRIRAAFASNQRQHFCITKQRMQVSGESDADFQYAKTKQELTARDLMRFNITTVFVEDYPRITDILRAIERRFRRRTVFISGSAVDYGTWGRAAVEDFITRLAGALIDRNYRIASGFGLGVGSAVVTGAVQQIYSSKNRSLDEQIVLRPFPVGIVDNAERQRTFERYREELIAQSGVGLFLIGNAIVDGATANAAGVREEFELAKQKGIYVVPVGSTGSMARELWNEVMGDFDNYFPGDRGKIRPLMEAIGKAVSQPVDLLEPILQLIDHLAEG